jgi:hypothetical protein
MVYCCVILHVAGHNALAIGHYNHYFTGEGNLADHLLVLCEAFILAARDLSV